MLITEVEAFALAGLSEITEESGVKRTISVLTLGEGGEECSIESGLVREIFINVRYGDEEGYVLSGGIGTDGVLVDAGELSELISELGREMARLSEEAIASGDAAGYFLTLARKADADAIEKLGELEESVSRSMKLGIGISVIALLLLVGAIIAAIVS